MISALNIVALAIGWLVLVVLISLPIYVVAMGMANSISLHVTMLKGMRRNGRKQIWRRLPMSLITHAWELSGLKFRTGSASLSYHGDGWYWDTNGDRQVFDAEANMEPSK